MKRFLFLLLINLLPLFFIVTCIDELIYMSELGANSYPWGESGINKGGWVYQSPEMYIIYTITLVVALMILVLLSLRASKTGKWRAYLLMLVASVAVYFTPLLPIM